MKPSLPAVLAAPLAALFAATALAQDLGPSTTTTPYLVASAPGVAFTSILSVGDSVPHRHRDKPRYRMVGGPDGLGAYDNGDGTITVLMNHELSPTEGVARAHGARGAFVSRWQIRKSDLKVLNGADLIDTVHLWNGSEHVAAAQAAFNRFCSADLPRRSAFFDARSGLGFGAGRIFMNGEENGPSGRAFAHVLQASGQAASYELPQLGRLSWENAVANPFAQKKTIVAGLDDGRLGSSQLIFYVGDKKATGKPVERAGLSHGIRYQLVMADVGANENGIAQGDTAARRFTLAPLGGTGFNRIEDGAWDPRHPHVFYFVTTASFTTNSRLWQLSFTDIGHPEAGGTIRVLLDGGTPSQAGVGPKMMDNLTIDSDGQLILQEDPSRQARLAKIWSFDPATHTLRELAAFDRARFAGAEAITQDEESSGVIEVSELFAGVRGYDTAKHRYYLLSAQVHKTIAATEPELVELGQLLLMQVAR